MTTWFLLALALPAGAVTAPLVEGRLRALEGASSVRASVESRLGRAAADDAARRLERWLGLLAEVQTYPALDADAVREGIAAGLAGGRYDALIFGETHSLEGERAYAKSVIEAALAAGALPGAFVREQYTFPDAAFLEERGVPVLTFRNQFHPDPEVENILKRHRPPVIAYAGHAHTAERVKDYIQNVLESGRPFGYGPGLKDMPTIERAFTKRRLKPAIVAMLGEEAMLSRVQWLALKQAVSGLPDAGELHGRLEEAVRVWYERLGRLPASYSLAFSQPWPGLKLFSHPKQDNLVIGITRGDRRPRALEAVVGVLRLPEAAAWLAGRKVSSVEALRYSSGGPGGSTVEGCTVILHRDDGAQLRRDVPLP